MTLTSPHPISSRMDSARLGLLYFVALSASLGTAVSAIGRCCCTWPRWFIWWAAPADAAGLRAQVYHRP